MSSGASSAAETRKAVSQAVESALVGLGGAAPQLGFLFASSRHELQAVLNAARGCLPRTMFLASGTAGEFTQAGPTQGGLCVMLLASDAFLYETRFATAVSKDPAEAAATLCSGFQPLSEQAGGRGYGRAMSLLLGDGLNFAMEKLVDEVREKTRAFHRIVGGGAGDDGAFKASWVGVDQRVATDAAVALHLFGRQQWGIGVGHGWSPASGKAIVTRSQGNVVHEINGRPAFELYRAYVGEKKEELEPSRLPGFLVSNELGLYSFNGSLRARAPLAVTPEGALVCAADVPQGSTVCIVRGTVESMTDAARGAALEALTELGGQKPAGVLVFDCVCRGLTMGPRFAEEVDTLRSVFGNVPIAGFLSYGEVARFKGRLDGYHNNTIVVVAVPA
jgi:hypothetical protein